MSSVTVYSHSGEFRMVLGIAKLPGYTSGLWFSHFTCYYIKFINSVHLQPILAILLICVLLILAANYIVSWKPDNVICCQYLAHLVAIGPHKVECRAPSTHKAGDAAWSASRHSHNFFTKAVYSFRRFNRNNELIPNCWRSHRESTCNMIEQRKRTNNTAL